MPILGKRIGAVLADEELTLEQMVVPGQEDLGEQWVLRYYDHAFPVAQGTESLPMHVLVDRQHYRLAYWKVGDEEINYRRFFDVGTLAAIRVEEPDVFAGSHGLILDLMRDGVINALRVDHPDGLADPGGYLTQLAEATSGAWIAAERFWRPTSPCPPPGRWPEPPATTPPGGSTSSRWTPPARPAWARSCRSSPGTHPWTTTASSRRPSERSSPAHWQPKSTVWPASWTA